MTPYSASALIPVLRTSLSFEQKALPYPLTLVLLSILPPNPKSLRFARRSVCPNCGARKEFGFSSVCIKYKTFVCDNCKSSHQAISHRCKSLTMSTWSQEEVDSMRKENGGGNDACRVTWLQKAPPPGSAYPGGRRPKAGDSLNVHKSFVVDAYERRKFYGEDSAKAPPPPPPAPVPFSPVSVGGGDGGGFADFGLGGGGEVILP